MMKLIKKSIRHNWFISTNWWRQRQKCPTRKKINEPGELLICRWLMKEFQWFNRFPTFESPEHSSTIESSYCNRLIELSLFLRTRSPGLNHTIPLDIKYIYIDIYKMISGEFRFIGCHEDFPTESLRRQLTIYFNGVAARRALVIMRQIRLSFSRKYVAIFQPWGWKKNRGKEHFSVQA